MRSYRPGPRARGRAIAPVLGLAILLVSMAGPAGAATPAALGLGQKQMIRTDRLDVLRPAGIAYAGDGDLFLVFPGASAATGSAPAARGVLLNRWHEGVGSVDLPVPLTRARAVAFDRRHQRLLELDLLSHSIHAIPGSPTGEFDAAHVQRLEAPRAAALRPVGMTVDPVSGEVFVLDRLMRRILCFTPAETPGTIPSSSWIDLGPLASASLTGLALDPRSGHLFTLDVVRRQVIEMTREGRLEASYDVSAIQLSDPQGLVFAPSGDQTDDPATWSLFVADPGLPATRRGNVIELAWTTPVSAASEETAIQATTAATLVRVTKTSLFSPPSPDPSGIAYDATTGRLVIDDGEVDEMPIYAGKQIWETSLSGQVLRTYNVRSYTDEPVGIACNPNNRHVFISDDDHDTVWDFNPGPDHLVGTSDDTRTSFKTNTFGSGDPEGLGYDPVGNRLFVTDGLNDEIYVVNAGPNGVFNGSGSDDTITHFDTARFGIKATDMVEWRSDTGTLLTLGSSGVMSVKELTTTGTLVSSIDVSPFPLQQPAGLAYAPSSTGGGMSIYIVNRALDNNAHPSENDGTMVELQISTTGPSNTAPTVNAGPDRTISLPAQASLDGTVTDDNLPSPPTLTTTWTKVSGPGTVTFGSANAVDTQAGFSAAGTYVLRLSASDGALSNNDQVQITVQPASGNTAPAVNAGLDQTITLPAQASLDGTVTDDNLPSPPALTTQWTKVSGPGTVTFANPNAVDTQAGFSAAGTYVLQLSAGDGQLSTNDAVQVTVQQAAGNTAPVVSAGLDQTIALSAQASLDGTATDDNRPSPPTLTTLWTKVSGPGTVTFANPNAVDTQADFSAAGIYVLQLSASDGQLSANDAVQVTVVPPGTPYTFRVASGLDDVEENASGSVYTTSTDLELVFDGSNQTVGLRFVNVNIPKNATITTATMQFQADEAQSESTTVELKGQASGNAPAFTTTKLDASGRSRTSASVTWTPPAWNTVGEAGAAQRTPDLKDILQEIVSRSDWVSGNSIVILITGTGHRTAESFEGQPAAAPLLQVQFQ